MAEHEKKKDAKQAKQPAKSSGVLNFDDLFQGADLAALKQLKATRDELDAGIPKILSLSAKERVHLAGVSFGAKMTIALRSGLQSYVSGGLANDEAGTRKRESLLEVLSIFLQIDPAGMSPSAKKTYEAEIARTWKQAKAALNEIVDTPAARKFLEEKPKKQ